MKPYFHLVDGAQVPKDGALAQLLVQWVQRGCAIDLYSALPKAMHLLGPVLCQLDADQLKTFHQVIGRDPRSWSYFISTLQPQTGFDFERCAEHLRQHALTVQAKDGLYYYLRFADTRILDLLPRVMNARQWSVFSQSWQQCVFMDRQGQLQCLDAKSVTPMEEGDGLLWNDAQIARLLDLTWPDALLNEVHKLRPAWRDQHTLAQQHAIAKHTYQDAIAQGKGEDIAWQIRACLNSLKVAT